MPRADRLQTFAWTAAALAIAGLFWLLGPILTPFVIAAVFAYICDPAVNWMTARRVPRALAVLLVIIALGLVLIALALILVPMVYREAMMLIRRLPDLVEMFNAQVAPILQARLGIELQPAHRPRAEQDPQGHHRASKAPAGSCAYALTAASSTAMRASASACSASSLSSAASASCVRARSGPKRNSSSFGWWRFSG